MSHWFYHRDKILAVPNKCGTVSAQTMLGRFEIDKKRVPGILAGSKPTVHVHCTTRNPVDFFVSGFRYLRRAPEYREGNHQLTFEQHLEACVRQHDKYQQRDWSVIKVQYFDTHSWWGPLRTVRYEVPIEQKINWIKLENTDRLPNFAKHFFKNADTSKGHMNSTNREQHGRFAWIPHPRLTNTEIEMMRYLDDWSEICGYSFKRSLKQYNNRINTV